MAYNIKTSLRLIYAKWYHVPFWAACHYLWAAAIYDSFQEAFHTLFLSDKGLQYVFIVIIQSFGVMFNIYYLLPKYLERGKVSAYVISLTTWTMIIAMILLSSYFFTSYLLGESIEYYGYFTAKKSLFAFFTTVTLPSTAIVMLLGLSIKLIKKFIQAKKRQQELEKEKLETELKFLRNQFNPHFLFNTINSIFFLIKKEPDKASSSLAQFSELLRYQLYESNEPFINLDQEITSLKNFIALERLRKSEHFKLDLHIEETPNRQMKIAPFILMTFVENAFKHVSKDKEKDNWISINLVFPNENTIQFQLANSKSNDEEVANEFIRHGGIGLKNVYRRLELIYPDKFTLDVKDQIVSFEIDLLIDLDLGTSYPSFDKLQPLKEVR